MDIIVTDSLDRISEVLAVTLWPRMGKKRTYIIQKYIKVCIKYDLFTFILKNLRRLFDKYAVARTEHDALVKSTTKIFSNFVAFSENPNFTS